MMEKIIFSVRLLIRLTVFPSTVVMRARGKSGFIGILESRRIQEDPENPEESIGSEDPGSAFSL